MSASLHRIVARIRGRTRGQEGFTIVETMVALAIVFTSLLALAFTTLTTLKDVAFSRQRQGATTIANQTLEEVRGLPYATVALGMDQTDLNNTIAAGTETNVVKTLGPPLTYTFRGENIPYGTIPATNPTVPHIKTFTLGRTNYTRRVYVTQATGSAAGSYRLTVIVSWAQAQRKGVAAAVEAQTFVYASPPTSQDCVSSQTHPFSAPCQPFFYGTGSIGQGSIHTTGTVEGLTFDSADIDLLQLNSDAQVEQVTQVQTGVISTGVRTTVSGTMTPAGAVSAVSAVDSDPGSSTSLYDTDSMASSGGVGIISSSGVELRVRADGSDSGTTYAAFSAGGTDICNGQTNGKPCGYVTATAGTVRQLLSITSSVGDATLVRSFAQPSASSAYSKRGNTGGGDGELRETVTKVLPEMQFFGLPSSITAPSGWNGYWLRLTGYTATAMADAGTNSVAPTRSITSGQVQVWNGVGYTSTNITTAGATVVAPPLSISRVNGSGDTIGVQISGTVRIEASPSPTSTFLTGSSTTRTDALATLGSPLMATINYVVTKNGSTKANLTININLGGVNARTTYQPAPTPS